MAIIATVESTGAGCRPTLRPGAFSPREKIWGRILIAGSLLLAAAACGSQAHAAIRRCIGPDGGTIYTDRPCDQFDAREQAPSPPTPGNTLVPEVEDTGPVRSDCARSAESLLFDLRRAVEHGDINAIAGLYHWPGTGGRVAVSVMDRLEDVVSDAGANVDLVYPDAAFVVDDPAAYPDLPPENPIGVRISRVVDATSGRMPEQILELHRYAACWWIHF